jgi:putative SOS response-associated peptidase YedK
MCGRFTIVTDPEKLMSRFQLQEIPFDLKPRYNIAPGQPIPAILADGGRRRIGQLRWGLVPSWAQDEKIGYKMINARAKTLQEKPAFRRLFERKRCMIPADGFYEWKQKDRGKQPMRIAMRDGELFSFAGLFDTWIVPVILRQEDEDIWLDRDLFYPDLLQPLLAPYDPGEMRANPVPVLIGNPKNDVPECIKELYR